MNDKSAGSPETTPRDYYGQLAAAAGVSRDDVKRVMYAAGFSGPVPGDVPVMTQSECDAAFAVMEDRYIGEANPSEVALSAMRKLDEGSRTGLLTSFHDLVARFNREIVGLPAPSEPTMLSRGRAEFAYAHLCEEVNEFMIACSNNDLDKAVDAIVDLVYVALGRLFEMGIAPGPVFEEVHAANMRKRRGTVAKRPNSAGHDAVKPDGWTPPNLTPYITVDREQVNFLHELLVSLDRGEARVVRGEAVKGLTAPSWLEYVSPVHVKIAELRRQKGEDYNSGGVAIPDYFPFGHRSYAQVIHMKDLRIKSLLAVMDDGREPNFEGLVDTVDDLINYATFYAEALQRGDKL